MKGKRVEVGWVTGDKVILKGKRVGGLGDGGQGLY